MLFTCYKTNDPEQLPTAEYYTVYIRAEKVGGVMVYYLDEHHGWFDAAGPPFDPRKILSEEFPTWEEAEEGMKARLRYLVAGGFFHGFVRDPFAPNGSAYRKIDPENL
jgi:hypothetical protein